MHCVRGQKWIFFLYQVITSLQPIAEHSLFGAAKFMLFLPSFAALRDWRFCSIFFVARGSKYLSTSLPLAPQILSKLANCIIWDKLFTFMKHVLTLLVSLTILLCPGYDALGAHKDLKILIVHSYHKTMPWVRDYTRGIRTTLTRHHDIHCILKHFYMDTKIHPEGAKEKARQAYKIFQGWRPDIVIACDDNAQKYFVVPYLKDKTSTPVVFLGVNEDPERYGYPAKNVTGVLERNHVVMTLELLQRLKPDCKRIAVLNDASPTGMILTRRIKKALSALPSTHLQVIGYYNTNSFEEWKRLVTNLQERADGLYFITYFTFRDKQGRHVPALEALKWLLLNSRLPEASNTMDTVRNGALCSIAIDGFISGEDAASILLDIFHGTKVSQIPLKRTERGLRLINRSRARVLGLKIPTFLVSGTIFFDSPFINSKGPSPRQ